MSAFVMITTGLIRLKTAMESSLSRYKVLGSGFLGAKVTNSVSRFAIGGRIREFFLSKISSIKYSLPLASGGRIDTRSPTKGESPLRRKAPLARQGKISPLSVRTEYKPPTPLMIMPSILLVMITSFPYRYPAQYI